ncbi:uncharacterized protein LODBEIA_P33240 [Lodderomyces beijingensis]|uniref:Golgi apyrase n=1 Tax=Lodderomyces beijingensis TaxID=1775926 RepID=A0ABP0ZLR8_9ASCO
MYTAVSGRQTMTIGSLREKRQDKTKHKKKPLKPGPLVSKKNGIPYDYLVIIDAGSKGSRVHVYSWLNPKGVLENEAKLAHFHKIRDSRKEQEVSSDDESDSAGEEEENKEGGGGGEKESAKTTLFPRIRTKPKWHKKIVPGISSFNNAPYKIGNHHLAKLLARASKIVPKSQHFRTPIFLHATAGMRLLPPTEQQQILNEICKFFQNQSDFFMPDCASHVNVIDGDYEGLYGWLSINTLIGAFDQPEKHQHGKNHTTYGLLDMGGASTQVVFQPNSTEIEEHQNNLYHIILRKIPALNSSGKKINFDEPQLKEFNVYSDSFLGFGMFQARSRYLSSLVASDDKEYQYHYWGRTKSPMNDPCIPKGFTTTEVVGDSSYDFIGESNFEKCLTNIFPVLQNSTHGGAPKANCKQFSEIDETSECLLNELIPSFDFDVNHFIGVSGYWDAINALLSQREKRDGQDDQKNDYDYQTIFNKTQKVCSQSWSTLLELNMQKKERKRLSEEELSQLCFKASWILNFLHLGLGFPRFGIDNPSPETNKGFQTLQLVEKLDGSAFSWALGRAMLYANDEYIQAFNNYTASVDESKSSVRIQRPGFFHSPSEALYQFGAEQNNIAGRPPYEPFDETKTYHYYDYEKYNDANDDDESKWNIEPHRWYGMIVFGLLLGIVAWLMIGSRRRQLFVTKVTTAFRKLVRMTPGYNGAKYSSVPPGDAEMAFELGELDKDDENEDDNNNDDDDDDDRFRISDDEEEGQLTHHS